LILSIVIDYPVWFILLCLAAGGIMAVILYLRNRKEELPLWLHRSLAVIRFVTVSVIAFLLLSPLLKSVTRTYEKPVIIIAQDNSQSMVSGKDSSYYRKDYPVRFDRMVKDLKKDYQVNVFTFGDEWTAADDGLEALPGLYGDKQTDISDVFDQVQTRYANRNVGAVVMATDGIYNNGLNPLYGSRKIGFPVFTIALGDTSVQKDLILSKVNYNRIAYRGDKFPVEAVIRAMKCSGGTSRLNVVKEGKVVVSQPVDIKNDNFTGTVALQLEAAGTGLQHYRFTLAPLSGEMTTANNSYDIFVDVIDNREKILLLSAAPHPDIAAIKDAIESNYNYEIKDFLLDDFSEPVNKYNMVILHQIPSGQGSASRVLTEARTAKLPVLFILGTQSNIPAFDQLREGLTIEGANGNYNEALPALNPGFVLFEISEATRRALADFPPLITPFGQYKVTPSANVILFQQIGRVTTQMPLVLLNEGQDAKTGVIAGEGLWRWRMMDYAHNDNHKAFDEIILKIIQYLSLKEDRGFFRVTGKNRYMENEMIEFNAEVYTKNYELINTPEVNMVITNDRDETFPFVFGRTSEAYYLNAGNLPVGNYTYHAQVKVGNDVYEKTGQFPVEALNVEKINTVANHNLLYNLAIDHSGVMFFPEEMERIRQTLGERHDIHTIIYSRKRYNELNNLLWILFLLIGLLSVEWFLRKFKGSY